MPLNIKKFESKVLRVKQETPEIMSFRFSTPPDFEYKAANHIILDLGIEVDGRKQLKSFSISSSPTHKGYIETAKRVSESEFSKKLASLKKGDTIMILGPYGMFILDESRDAVMLSGGIGITPLRNMIQYATEKRLPIKITLIYSNKTPEEIAFKDELNELLKKNPNLRVHYTITRPEEGRQEWHGLRGRIDEQMIKKLVPNLHEVIFYICGPPSMVNAMNEMLIKMGIPSTRIKLERFTGYE
ncbi:MAG: FAD-dependent oxidoreductase [Nanoarchaeota archaeon]